MSDHTPGPWTFGDAGWDGNPPYVNIWQEGSTPTANIIASVLSEDVGLEAAKNNAALIVAAPEMFDVIKGALIIKSIWVPSEDKDDPAFSALDLMCKQFEDVIAKVEGND